MIAMQFGWTGPNLCISTACAAGAQRDRRGRAARSATARADVVMAGGTEVAHHAAQRSPRSPA